MSESKRTLYSISAPGYFQDWPVVEEVKVKRETERFLTVEASSCTLFRSRFDKDSAARLFGDTPVEAWRKYIRRVRSAIIQMQRDISIKNEILEYSERELERLEHSGGKD